MASLIEGIGNMAVLRDRCSGLGPSMAGLACTMQQQYRIALAAEHISNKFVSGSTCKGHYGESCPFSGFHTRSVRPIIP